MSILVAIGLGIISNIIIGFVVHRFHTKILNKMFKTNDDLIKLFDEQTKLVAKWRDAAQLASKDAEYYYNIGITLSQRLLQVDPSFKQQATNITKGPIN